MINVYLIISSLLFMLLGGFIVYSFYEIQKQSEYLKNNMCKKCYDLWRANK